MSVERVPSRRPAVQLVAQPVAAIVALILLIDGLATAQYGSWRWPLTVVAVVLGAGLLVGRLPHLGGRELMQRSAPGVAAVVAMIVILSALSLQRVWPRWPLSLTALVLGVGFLAGPVAQLVHDQPLRRSAQTVAMLVSLTVLIVALAGAQWASSHWPLLDTALILGAGLVGARLAQLTGAGPVQRSVQGLAAGAALVVLVWALSLQDVWPRWPLSVTAIILGLGLLATPLARLAGQPRRSVLSDRVDELSRTRRGALDVQASELRRIERDLHDGAQARLVALSMKLGRAEDRFRDDAETAALLREAREDATAAIRELRELARGIAPPVLTDRGLEAAVRSLAQRSGAEVSVSGQLERRPLPAVETAAYFVVAESLTNAAKHAPGARVEIRLDERGGDLFVEITDFGPGRADVRGGGLTGLRQRVEALDGALHVLSPAGVGTQVEAVLPCGR